MSLPLGWKGWDIPWAVLSLVPKGLTPVPEDFAPFCQLGQVRETSESWKGVEILQRFSPSLIFHPPLEHLCGCPVSAPAPVLEPLPKPALKKPLHCGVHPAKKDPATSPEIDSPLLPNPVFLQPAPCGDLGWGSSANSPGSSLGPLPMGIGCCGVLEWVLGGALKHLGVI